MISWNFPYVFFTDFARRPIDENNPSGSNPNGSEDFDEIKRQINNLNKVTGRVSWKTVQTLSKKDLEYPSERPTLLLLLYRCVNL